MQQGRCVSGGGRRCRWARQFLRQCWQICAAAMPGWLKGTATHRPQSRQQGQHSSAAPKDVEVGGGCWHRGQLGAPAAAATAPLPQPPGQGVDACCQGGECGGACRQGAQGWWEQAVAVAAGEERAGSRRPTSAMLHTYCADDCIIDRFEGFQTDDHAACAAWRQSRAAAGRLALWSSWRVGGRRGTGCWQLQG